MKNILILISLLVFSSCSPVDKKSEKYFKKQIITLIPNLGRCYTKVIILPGSGCSGCITVGENFFKDNYHNPKYLFILTNITSLKIFNYKIGINVSQLSNIILDYDNIYSKHEMSIYPIVINYNCIKRKVESIIYQKPGSDAFAKV